jgi:DNA-binding beta-propeller fold protein YncE
MTARLITAVVMALTMATAGLSQAPALKRAEDYRPKIPVSVIKEIKLPRGYHEGLFHDGKYIWVANGKGGNTWVVDPSTGAIVAEIGSVGKFSEGITASEADGTYWTTDWDDKKLYRVKRQGDTLSVIYEISLEPEHPAGLVWTGKKLYVITWERGKGGTSYFLSQLDDKEHLSKKFRINRIHEPAHIAWDGKYLWITSWYSRLVYKVDVENFDVLGSFKSPVDQTTGITWDGEHFWITGTKADLYQILLGEE